jgi:HSP20 family molecular chaperone IbpA
VDVLPLVPVTPGDEDSTKGEEKKKKKVVYRKQMISSVDYTTQLPRPIDAAGIEAEVVNGVVTIHAPIAEAAKPKKIAVKTSAKK